MAFPRPLALLGQTFLDCARERKRERERGREGESLWGFLLQTLLEPEIKNERIRKNVKSGKDVPQKLEQERKKGMNNIEKRRKKQGMKMASNKEGC